MPTAKLKTVTEIGRAPLHRRLVSSVAKRIAGVFLAVTMLGFAALVAFIVSVTTGWTAYVYVNTDAAPVFALAGFVLALLVVWIVAAGKKRIVLYLRKFRQESANSALSKAMYRSLRSVGRLVTLDDSTFKAISVPLRERLTVFLSTAPYFAIVLLVSVTGIAVSGDVRYEGRGLSLEQRGGWIAVNGIPPSMIDADLQPTPILLSFPGGIALWLALALTGLLAIRAIFTGWEAHRRVRSDRELSKLLRRIDFLGSWLSAPRSAGSLATVATVADEQWKASVSAIAEESCAIILDVSHPTESIWWELELCFDRYPDKLLVILNINDNSLGGETSSDFAHYDELCDRVSESRAGAALAYDFENRKGRKAFYRSLRNFVESAR